MSLQLLRWPLNSGCLVTSTLKSQLSLDAWRLEPGSGERESGVGMQLLLVVAPPCSSVGLLQP